MKKILSVIALFISLSILSSNRQKVNEPIQIKIGGLLSLTGEWSSLGITSQEAMNIAISEINARMEQTASPYRFSTVIYDTKLDTSAAKAALRKAFQDDIRFIIGPQSSVEVDAIRNFANTNGILVVSQGSTAGSLAIANDAIFRFCPGDAAEGDAMAQAIYASGRRSIITLTSDDAGNKGLQQAIGYAFTNRGGTVDALPPFPTNTTNFSSVLANLKNKILQRSRSKGLENVGVYLASFDGVKDLFHQASLDPIFRSVRWYGGDAIALNTALLSDASACSFASAVKLFAPSFGLPQQAHPNLASITFEIKNRTGIEADAYSLAVYDALWVIARTIAAFPEPSKDFTKIKEVFQKEANQFYGITGPTFLNSSGDRGTGSFDFWGIVDEGGTYRWQWVGSSSIATSY